MGIFSCPCVVCVSGWCVCAGSRGLLKLSQDGRNWQVGRRWERCRRQSGIGGYSHKRITGGLRRYSDFRITVSEAMAILDNLYRKCYNKCNDDNKNVICHQTVKFTLYGVFAVMDIKSCGTPENVIQRIYIKTGNTKTVKMCAVGGQQKTAYLYI